jgi:hypothetical protein
VHKEGREEEERKRDMQGKSADRIACFHLIYYKEQLCGHSPRERVNHIYPVVVCD